MLSPLEQIEAALAEMEARHRDTSPHPLSGGPYYSAVEDLPRAIAALREAMDWLDIYVDPISLRSAQGAIAKALTGEGVGI